MLMILYCLYCRLVLGLNIPGSRPQDKVLAKEKRKDLQRLRDVIFQGGNESRWP